MTAPIDIGVLKQKLCEIVGNDESVGAVCEMDPVIAQRFIDLATATTKRKVLDDKTRSLINIALSATVTDLKEKYTRVYIANALRHGATQAEICEVLQLTSVLGIHGFIPGIQLLLEVVGGLEAVKQRLSEEELARAKAAMADFSEIRGIMTPVWEANAHLSPDLLSAYAAYSGTPWQSSALDPKVKEFIYIAIDLSPSHLELTGAVTHMRYALESYGASIEEIVEVLELIVLVGFQTQLLALPILKEELAKLRSTQS